MSRQWKKPNYGLPGWGAYAPALYSKPPKRKARNNKRRRFKNSIRNRRERAHPLKPTTKSPKPCLPNTVKWLAVETTPPSLAVFCRENGAWRCTYADPVIEWFTRIRHTSAIRDWLRHQRLSFRWYHHKPSGAELRPDVATRDRPSPAQGLSAPPINGKQPQPCDGKSASGDCLEQNDITKSRCLMRQGVNPGPATVDL